MKSVKKFLIVILIFILNIGGCGKKETADAHKNPNDTHISDDQAAEHANEIVLQPEVIAEVGIVVTPVTKREFKQLKTFPGIVVPRPDGDAHVGSLIGGRVVAIPVGLGDKVRVGAPLCRIESPEVGAAQAAYIRSAAEFEVAQQEFIRQQKLQSEQIGAEKTLYEKQAAARAAKAELSAAERTLYSIGFSQTEIETVLDNPAHSGILTLKSPIAGTVTDWQIKLGQRIDPNDDLFHIIDLTRLWIQISLFEMDLANVQLHQSVQVIPQSFPDKIFQGKIIRMGKEVDKEKRTVKGYIEVNNENDLLIPNLFVTCQVETCTGTEQVLAVPEEAVVMDEHGDHSVYLEHEPNCFLAREIVIGRTSSGWVEVIEGIKEGERVVFKGAFFIKSEAAKGSFGHGHVH